MRPLLVLSLCLPLLAACADEEDVPPPVPPPQPTTTPTYAPPPPPTDLNAPPLALRPDGGAPTPTPASSASAGPLPALPSQAPQYAAATPAEEAPPPQSQWVYSYPNGQWVYTATDGWVWVPAGATATEVEGVPYVYMYTAPYGWTWYVSPWGWGPYHYGVWVAHPWRPVGWHGAWVAHPRVVVRLGHPHYGHFGGHHRR
jgi:hypothetical protein